MMSYGGCLCGMVALLQLVTHRGVVAQQTTGVQFCEGHGWGRQACLEQRDCCEWNKRDRACYSAVGDALCGLPSTGGGFSVGDEVFIGDGGGGIRRVGGGRSVEHTSAL
eukprot:COSAG02_NODE_32274_length_519_cov_0.652381_1_plen_108_part_10